MDPSQQTERIPEILFIDDNPADSDLVEEAFRQYEVPARFDKVTSGARALAQLRAAADDGRPLPDLVLLDVNLPLMDGHEILRAIRADPRLRDLQVVMLSSSDRRGDIEHAEALDAASYVIKPSNWDEYLVLVRGFQQRLKRREAETEADPLAPPDDLRALQDPDGN